MTPIMPKCYECKHGYGLNFIKPSCEAFPNGIPSKIFYEGSPHTKPLPDQKNDIVFEPIDK